MSYVFNVYLPILTVAHNALFLVSTPPIAFLPSSCTIYVGIAYYPLFPPLYSRAIFTRYTCLWAWIVSKHLPVASDAVCSFPFIAVHSIISL